MSVEEKLTQLGLKLPAVTKPQFLYEPTVRSGNLLWVSGQIPRTESGTILHSGKVGDKVTLEQGQEAARLCVLNGLAWIQQHLGSLDKVARVVKVVGFVASAQGFTDQPKVINGASELLISVFGDNGRHARSAVGVFELPLGCSVEVEMVVEIKP